MFFKCQHCEFLFSHVLTYTVLSSLEFFASLIAWGYNFKYIFWLLDKLIVIFILLLIMFSSSVNFLVVSFAHMPSWFFVLFLFICKSYFLFSSSVFCLYLMKITFLSLLNSVIYFALESLIFTCQAFWCLV